MSLYPRMKVLHTLYELTEEITPNRFITTRPMASGEEMEEFLLIRLPQRIDPTADTYQLTIGQIVIFVRNIQEELENTFRLEELQEAITEMFPISTPLFLATHPVLLPGGSDGAGFHTLIIQFNIRIHKDFDCQPNEIVTL